MTIDKEVLKIWDKHFKSVSFRELANESGVSAPTIIRVLKTGKCNGTTFTKLNNYILNKKKKVKQLIKQLDGE